MPRRIILPLALVLALLLLSRATHADPLDRPSADALGDALRMLEDPAARTGVAGKGTQAPALDPQLKALTESPELSQEFYALAAQIFSEMVQNAAGDVGKMNETVTRGKSDPEAFAASLSPATRARLQALADKIEARKQ